MAITKRQLHAYRDIQKDIAEMEERLFLLDCKAQKITTRFSDEPHVSSLIQDSMAETIAAKVDLAVMINTLTQESYKEMANIEAAIESLAPQEKRLMRLRYIDGIKWEAICGMMFISWRQIHRIHASALQNLGAT